MSVLSVTTTESRTAAARSRIYQALARSFTMPVDETSWATLNSHSERRAVSEAFPQLPVHFDAMRFMDEWDEICKNLSLFTSALELQQEYLRLFEASEKRAPCPLYESFYRKEERRDTMAELVRFYNFFGLTLGERAKEMPDHLCTELEFMHYMAYLEAQELESGRPVTALARAGRDVIERHFLKWLPQFCQRLLPHGSEYFSGLAQICFQFLRSDFKYLKSRGVT